MSSKYTAQSSPPQPAVFTSPRPTAQPHWVRARRLSEAVTTIIVIEFLVVGLSAYAAGFVYHFFGPSLPSSGDYDVYAAAFIAVAMLSITLGFRHFESIKTQVRHRHLWNGIGAVGLAFSLLLTSLFLLKTSEDYSRGSFVLQMLAVGLAVIITRVIAFSWLQSAIASGTLAARRVVLIGDRGLSSHFAQRLKATGVMAVASFEFPASMRLSEDEPGADCAMQALLGSCRIKHPDDIIILGDHENFSATPSLMRKLSELPVNIHIVPSDAMDLLATSRVAEFGNLKTFEVSSVPLSSFDLVAKRTFDVVAAATGLILFAPLFLCAAVAIKFDSPGPILFRQMRYGYNKQAIKVFKFRTMTTTFQDGSAFGQLRNNAGHVTSVGQILRRTKIDELPQLLNVLIGQMSIVGPRPYAAAHNDIFEETIPPFARRHNVKPGITGWAQVNGVDGETDTAGKTQDRMRFDLYYIDNWSFLLDLKIIVMAAFSKQPYIDASN